MASSEQRRWRPNGNRIERQSINDDPPGSEDDFPCMNEATAVRLAIQLNTEETLLRARAARLEEALRETHDLLDDANADQSVKWACCKYCAGINYNGDGLMHTSDCILVKMRSLLSSPDTTQRRGEG